jgi:plasmid maintenance system antidote protein VapI
MISLLDLCRSYPGGVDGLAKKMGVAPHRVYKFASGRHANTPVDLVRRVSESFGRSTDTLISERVTQARLLSMWDETRTSRAPIVEVEPTPDAS